MPFKTNKIHQESDNVYVRICQIVTELPFACYNTSTRPITLKLSQLDHQSHPPLMGPVVLMSRNLQQVVFRVTPAFKEEHKSGLPLPVLARFALSSHQRTNRLDVDGRNKAPPERARESESLADMACLCRSLIICTGSHRRRDERWQRCL